MSLVEKIDAILPQTQCGQCGYNGCKPYAKAIASGVAHNQCPPGGARVIGELSVLLKREPLALNPQNGQHQPKVLAKIREAECIGCTKCIQACPVDAIFGRAKMMHTVIADECTGCELCVEPCPVDCIDLIAAPMRMQPDLQTDNDRLADSTRYRQRHQNKADRLQRLAKEEKQKHQQNKNSGLVNKSASIEEKKAFIQAAIARSKRDRKQG